MITLTSHLYTGDCLAVMATLPASSVDAIVTDPPYGLGFMGKAWDNLPPGLPWAQECLRVLKPGGHLLAFGGTRTSHRLTCAVEDAGFEIRDSIAWLYGSGFPKSLDVGKAIDKAAGATRDVVGTGPFASRRPRADRDAQGLTYADDTYVRPAGHELTSPATDAAREWDGWGTALKPAHEPIVVARKPLTGTVAQNVQEHGTGALNIDGCRVGDPGDKKHCGSRTYSRFDPGSPAKERQVVPRSTVGRWPANVVLDGEMADQLDQQSGTLTSGGGVRNPPGSTHGFMQGRKSVRRDAGQVSSGDAGGASRFFPTFRYQAKAPPRERPKVDGLAHPTVKPLALMQWLVRLVTPPGGTVLDPFLGSGTTAQACVLEGFDCIGIEADEHSMRLVLKRLGAAA